MPNGTFNDQDRKDFDRLKTDMWWGNGDGKVGIKPRVGTLEEDIVDIRKSQAKISSQLWALIMLALMTLTGIITVLATRAPATHSFLQ